MARQLAKIDLYIYKDRQTLFLLNSPTFLIPKGLVTFSAARVRPKAKDSLRSRPEAIKAEGRRP